jgi:hypothetical protein
MGFEVEDLTDPEVEAAATLLKAWVTEPLKAAEARRRNIAVERADVTRSYMLQPRTLR